MGFLSPLVEKRDSLNGATALHPKDPALADLWSGGINSSSGQNVTSESAMAVSTVYACVERISKTLAMLPLNVMKKIQGGGHEIATNHRLQRQLHFTPNRWMTSYIWRKLCQNHIMLRGNSYNLISAFPGRGINELVPMHPDRVWPFIITPNGATCYMYDNSPCPPPGSKLYYQYFPLNGNTVILTADEVLHIKGATSNGIVGKNVVQLMKESIGLAMATEEQGARLFSNGAQIGKIFKHPTKMSDAVYDRVKKQVNTEFAGSSNAHKTMILEEGMDIVPTTLTMEDAQFLATRQFQVEDIASFLDVPLMLINRSGDKNQTFASAEQIFTVFSTIQMSPHYVNWEQELGEALLYPSEKLDYYLDFDADAIMRGDSSARANFYQKLFGTASITIDEIRAKEHMSPLPNGQGSQVYIMSNMVPLEMAGKHLVDKTLPESTGATL